MYISEPFRCIWRSIHIWQESARLILQSRLMHLIESAVVIVDVSISSTAIDFVHHVCKLAIEAGMRVVVRDMEGTLSRVVFCLTGKHFILYLFYLSYQRAINQFN